LNEAAPKSWINYNVIVNIYGIETLIWQCWIHYTVCWMEE